MVERLHRSIKIAITARNESLLLTLAIVLLGERSLPNENGLSPFKAVTGSSILMPQIMLDSSENFSGVSDCSNEFIRKLRNEMLNLDFDALSKGIFHGNKKSFIPKNPCKCDKIWLRLDRV